MLALLLIETVIGAAVIVLSLHDKFFHLLVVVLSVDENLALTAGLNMTCQLILPSEMYGVVF